MKLFSLLIFLALASGADDTTVTYDASLKCGKCIKGGYNYCFVGTDGDVVASGGSEPTATCCEDSTCNTASDSDYVCSSTYTDAEYALTMCPQKQDNCGTNQTVTFTETGTESNLTVSGLSDGDSCTYIIKSSKGSPCFKVS
jgi:hypothetical protein